MPAIRLAAFAGEQPQLVPRLLPATGAQSAINARLDNGALTPYRRPTLEASLTPDEDPFVTIYKHGEDWLGFTGVVNAAPGPVADDRLYYTGDGKPKLRIDDDTTYDLELNGPTAAPTATMGGSGSGDVTTRIYAYTFVTALGEESEPSPASNEIAWQSGKTVTISGIQNAPGSPDRGITKQRFYRSQSGTVGTDFYFIAERNVSASDFSDTVAPDDFAEALPSRTWNPPPDDLEGLITMPNGMMAAFVGKQLYFCDPFRPHAWPEIYVQTCDQTIVALAAMGTTLWVLTEGVPYRVTGTTPDTMVMDKVEANLPCINARGVVDLGHAVAWPSNDGLAVARGDGSVTLASANLFSPLKWQKLNPATMRAGQIQGRWIGSYNTTDDNDQPIAGSLIIDLSGQTSFLIRSAVNAAAWFYDIKTSFAYYLDDVESQVLQFDSPTGSPEQLYWRSKQFVLGKPDTFGAILVETGAISAADAVARQEEIDAIIEANEELMTDDEGIGGAFLGRTLGSVTLAGDLLLPVPPSLGAETTIGVYADGVKVATIGETDRVKRLPAGFTARVWEVDVFGDIEVVQITVARTVDELKIAAVGP